ncbi:hypothetical protein CASFOL_008958 [Castilleja foliolosa]|uniref:Mitochondrial transcription termination factor family protein n=1 Tax=Castilleja foliolosa TaxID=1961234 RepID=A0ABD3E0G5_9LAMI
MFAFLCRRGLIVPPKHFNLLSHQNAVLFRLCTSSVCENAPENSFTVSYLINSCGLSSSDAVSASNKLFFKSPEKPDAVLNLLREFGFTDANITTLVTRWPNVLTARCPNKTLLPKLQFFQSIGVPLPVLSNKLSVFPFILKRSLENSITPLYKDLRKLLGSKEGAVHVFKQSPGTFGRCCSTGISSSISFLKERGVSQSTIVSLVIHQPVVLDFKKERLCVYVDRAVEMGFDLSASSFVRAMGVFLSMKDSTLKRKMEVYRSCGWSESDIRVAFLRHPVCMYTSEEKIMACMGFLVDEIGCEPGAIAQCPALLMYSLDKRLKPRCLVARVLDEKGLLKKTIPGMYTLLKLSEKLFLRRCIDKYKKDVPELPEIYRGKSSLGL